MALKKPCQLPLKVTALCLVAAALVAIFLQPTRDEASV
jgi:hypothetical protein